MTKKDIPDKPEPNVVIDMAKLVPVQEKLGQLALASSTQLPIKGLLGERARWEVLGVKILDDVKSDDSLFCHVELPPGWRKVPRDHDYWTDLVDAEGTVHAEIFYKAAFYDRRANVRLTDPPARETDDDPYEGSFREAADNEGARIAAESRNESETE